MGEIGSRSFLYQRIRTGVPLSYQRFCNGAGQVSRRRDTLASAGGRVCVGANGTTSREDPLWIRQRGNVGRAPWKAGSPARRAECRVGMNRNPKGMFVDGDSGRMKVGMGCGGMHGAPCAVGREHGGCRVRGFLLPFRVWGVVCCAGCGALTLKREARLCCTHAEVVDKHVARVVPHLQAALRGSAHWGLVWPCSYETGFLAREELKLGSRMLKFSLSEHPLFTAHLLVRELVPPQRRGLFGREHCHELGWEGSLSPTSLQTSPGRKSADSLTTALQNCQLSQVVFSQINLI